MAGAVDVCVSTTTAQVLYWSSMRPVKTTHSFSDCCSGQQTCSTSGTLHYAWYSNRSIIQRHIWYDVTNEWPFSKNYRTATYMMLSESYAMSFYPMFLQTFPLQIQQHGQLPESSNYDTLLFYSSFSQVSKKNMSCATSGIKVTKSRIVHIDDNIEILARHIGRNTFSTFLVVWRNTPLLSGMPLHNHFCCAEGSFLRPEKNRPEDVIRDREVCAPLTHYFT